MYCKHYFVSLVDMLEIKLPSIFNSFPERTGFENSLSLKIGFFIFMKLKKYHGPMYKNKPYMFKCAQIWRQNCTDIFPQNYLCIFLSNRHNSFFSLLIDRKLYQSSMNNTEPDKISNVEEALTKDGFPLYKHGYELIATPIPPEKERKVREAIYSQECNDMKSNC